MTGTSQTYQGQELEQVVRTRRVINYLGLASGLSAILAPIIIAQASKKSFGYSGEFEGMIAALNFAPFSLFLMLAGFVFMGIAIKLRKQQERLILAQTQTSTNETGE